jgi:23S rRNA pseudouridine2605 synthase
MLHKPVGVLTTLDDPEGRHTVREFLPPGPRLFPVGRLDADTSGLLLLTNDGELAHRLTHPRYGVAKVYRVRLAGPPAADQVRRLRDGVAIEPGVVTSPAEVRVRNARPGRSEIEIVLHEGRYRQVRRMCEAVGLTVTALHRAAYGPLRLGGLARGEVRALTAFEVAKLREESARPGGMRARLENTRRRLTARAAGREEEPTRARTGWPAGPAFDSPRRARPGRFPGERDRSDTDSGGRSPRRGRLLPPGRQGDQRGSTNRSWQGSRGRGGRPEERPRRAGEWRGSRRGSPNRSRPESRGPGGRPETRPGQNGAWPRNQRRSRLGMGQTPVRAGKGRTGTRSGRRAGPGRGRGTPAGRGRRRFYG